MTEVTKRGFTKEEAIKGLNEYYAAKGPNRQLIIRGQYTCWCLLAKDVASVIDWLRDEHNIFYTPGMKIEEDIFDNPRYKFLSILSSELGFRTIVGPGNADKTENAIIRAVKCRNDELKSLREQRDNAEKEREDICEALDLPDKADNEDILDEIKDLKDHRDSSVSAQYVMNLIDNLCRQRQVVSYVQAVGVDHVNPDVHSYITYIFDVINTVRKERDEANRARFRYKGMLNSTYGLMSTHSVPESWRTALIDVYKKVFDSPYYVPKDPKNCAAQIIDELDKIRKQINYEPVLRRNMVIEETYNALFGERMTKPVGDWNEGELTSLMVDEILAWKKAFREVHSEVTGDIVNTLTASPSALKEGILHKFDSCTGDRDFFMNKMNLAVDGKKATEDVLAELRAKVREVYREMYLTGGDEPDSYIECLDLILEEYRRVVQDKRSTKDWRKFESDRNEFIAKLFEALELSHDGISCLYVDEEAAILKAIKDNNEATASIFGWNQAYSKVRDILGVNPDSDAEAMVVAAKALTKKLADESRRRSEWHNRYLSEHKRANGEHERAEKCFGEIAALRTQVAHLQKQVYSQVSVDSAIDALKHEIRTLREEKLHVISALGQDIWDDCVK